MITLSKADRDAVEPIVRAYLAGHPSTLLVVSHAHSCDETTFVRLVDDTHVAQFRVWSGGNIEVYFLERVGTRRAIFHGHVTSRAGLVFHVRCFQALATGAPGMVPPIADLRVIPAYVQRLPSSETPEGRWEILSQDARDAIAAAGLMWSQGKSATQVELRSSSTERITVVGLENKRGLTDFMVWPMSYIDMHFLEVLAPKEFNEAVFLASSTSGPELMFHFWCFVSMATGILKNSE